MQTSKILDPTAAARLLTVTVLAQADRAFPRQRRAMEQKYHLRNGIFSRV